MHTRYDSANIPIELLRTLVAIVDLGTVTKAAESFGLTQPAVSAQIRRLQQIVGTEILEKWGAGVRPTAQGEIVMRYARRILAMNDQILLHARMKANARAVRIGIAPVFDSDALAPIFKTLGAIGPIDNFQIACARLSELSHRLTNGFVDIAVMPRTPDNRQPALASWSEPMVWICARDFLLSPGKPIPLIGCPGSVTDQIAIDALDQAGRLYTLTFVADDWAVRLLALQAGLGYMAVPQRAACAAFKTAREHYLPQLPVLTTCVFARADALAGEYDAEVGALQSVLGPAAAGQVEPEPATRMRPRQRTREALTH